MPDVMLWFVIFLLVFFCGIFFLVLYCVRSQDKAMNAIFQQQKAVRMEVARLAETLDSLMADQIVPSDEMAQEAMPEEYVPGVDHLLLGNAASSPSRITMMPDMNI